MAIMDDQKKKVIPAVRVDHDNGNVYFSKLVDP